MEDHFVESRAMPTLIATAMAQLTTTTGMMVVFANVQVATAEMIVRLRHRGKQQPRFQMATPQKLYVVALTMSSSNGASRGNPH
jgi:ERCC4-type nuclease